MEGKPAESSLEHLLANQWGCDLGKGGAWIDGENASGLEEDGNGDCACPSARDPQSSQNYRSFLGSSEGIINTNEVPSSISWVQTYWTQPVPTNSLGWIGPLFWSPLIPLIICLPQWHVHLHLTIYALWLFAFFSLTWPCMSPVLFQLPICHGFPIFLISFSFFCWLVLVVQFWLYSHAAHYILFIRVHEQFFE